MWARDGGWQDGETVNTVRVRLGVGQRGLPDSMSKYAGTCGNGASLFEIYTTCVLAPRCKERRQVEVRASSTDGFRPTVPTQERPRQPYCNCKCIRFGRLHSHYLVELWYHLCTVCHGLPSPQHPFTRDPYHSAQRRLPVLGAGPLHKTTGGRILCA